jgi:hypothetical protein
MNNLSLALARRLGIVVIASAYRTEDPGFESRQGVRFLGIYTLQCSCRSLIFIVIVCTWEKEMLNKKICRRWVCRRYFEHIFEDIYVHISLSLSLSLSRWCQMLRLRRDCTYVEQEVETQVATQPRVNFSKQSFQSFLSRYSGQNFIPKLQTKMDLRISDVSIWNKLLSGAD